MVFRNVLKCIKYGAKKKGEKNSVTYKENAN